MSDDEVAVGGHQEPAPRPAENQRPAPEANSKDGGEGKDGAEQGQEQENGGTDPEEHEREVQERERTESRFREVGSDPRDDGEEGEEGTAGRAAAEAHRSARAAFGAAARHQHSHHDPVYAAPVHFGDNINLRLEALRAAAVFSGPVPEAELARLRRTYRRPQGYQKLEQALRDRRLLVLGAAPGSGRTCTALVLLDEHTAERTAEGQGTDGSRSPQDGSAPQPPANPPDPAPAKAPQPASRISRLDPRTALTELTAESLKERGSGHGFVLEIPEGHNASRLPEEVHLDAFAAVLESMNSFAVVIVASGTATTPLLSGRYGMLCPAAPTYQLLAARLEERLASRSEQGRPDQDRGGADAGPHTEDTVVEDPLTRATELARDPEIRAAVGLEELRPVEAEQLADLLAAHVLGTLSREELLDRCGGLVTRQAYEWFAGLDRNLGGEDLPGSPSAATLMYPAAFRIALSVFNDSAHSVAAEAAHALAWEMAVTREPERSPARPLFCDDQPVALGLCRAVLGEGRVLVADVPVPVRTVRYQGAALPTAVLEEVWMRHHAARAPVVRWLRSLADDHRPQVRIRAAVAAGELCVHDFEYGYEQFIRPMATASGARRRMFAATALDQAAGDPVHLAGVRALISAWAKSGASSLRWTAAVALGYGHATETVGAALDLLARIGTRNDGEHLSVVSHSVVLLAARADDMAVLRRIGVWLRGRRRDRRDQDLGLLSVARLAATDVGDIWDNEAAPDLADYQKWPLALALAAAREGHQVPIADLVSYALQVLRSREALIASLETWLRRATPDGTGQALFAELAELLPLLTEDEEDRERLRWLITRMVEDEDDPLPAEQARRIWRTVEPGPPTPRHRQRERV